MIGPGRYDKLCTLVRNRAHARAVMLMVIAGNDGSGFSIQAPVEDYPAIVHALRAAADEIERDLRGTMN